MPRRSSRIKLIQGAGHQDLMDYKLFLLNHKLVKNLTLPALSRFLTKRLSNQMACIDLMDTLSRLSIRVRNRPIMPGSIARNPKAGLI